MAQSRPLGFAQAGLFVLSFIDVQVTIYGRDLNMKIIALIALLAAFSLSGCETMEGLGRDLQNLGDAIEEEASDDKENASDDG